VAEEEYRHMLEAQVGVASNLREFSFGKVPAAISDFIERTLGIGWFRGVALASGGELFADLLVAGGKGREPPEDEEIRVFSELAANAIMRKRAEERVNSLLAEKELLLQEVHHRIKNNMSTMVSLLSIQARAIGEAAAKEALTDAMGRLQSMSTLYDKLFRAEDLREMSLREYLPTLVWEIVGMFPNGDAVDVETDIDDIRLGVKKLSVVGIMVNEIVTNSMKYAFAGRGSGRILVSARLHKGRVRLVLGDDGAGMPPGIDLDSSKGFGLSLIRILSNQLEAAVSVERKKGTSFSIEFERG
jgi:two-component sensor histidine kinase